MGEARDAAARCLPRVYPEQAVVLSGAALSLASVPTCSLTPHAERMAVTQRPAASLSSSPTTFSATSGAQFPSHLPRPTGDRAPTSHSRLVPGVTPKALK